MSALDIILSGLVVMSVVIAMTALGVAERAQKRERRRARQVDDAVTLIIELIRERDEARDLAKPFVSRQRGDRGRFVGGRV